MGFLHALKKKGHSQKRITTDEGFTLIELVIVVAIMGILAAIAIPSFGAIQENTRVASGETTAKNTYAALVASTTGLDATKTPEEILDSANADNDELAVSVNENWSNEDNLCVTVHWVTSPTSIQNYGPGCA